MPKELRCGDIVEGCDFVVRDESEDRVLAEAARHAAEAHGIEELDAETAEKVKQAIRTV